MAIESFRSGRVREEVAREIWKDRRTIMVQVGLFNVLRKIHVLDFLDVYFSGVFGAFRKAGIIRADTVPIITMTGKV